MCRSLVPICLVVLSAVVAACSSREGPGDAGRDTGVAVDAPASEGGGDAARLDGTSDGDSGTSDAGGIDSSVDGGRSDAGGLDGGERDGGERDGGERDGGASDSSVADTSLVDGMRSDAPGTALGDCVTAADCSGGVCVELTPGGYRVCQRVPVEATRCESGPGNECCNSGDCRRGRCYLAVRRVCGGPDRAPFNVCMTDVCADASDCASGAICAPAGTFSPVRVCVSAWCLRDSDCTTAANGHCVVFTDPCCGVRTGLVCTYGAVGSSACRSNGDCTVGYCGVGRDGVAQCRTDGEPMCPL